ncbi:MAG TPA: MFS transporter [Mycobacteriales bacterium]|nr:MFS transporter [Mycobacteriales bacterium]
MLESGYVAVLRRRRVPRLLGAALGGRLTTGMAPLAILLLVRDTGGSYVLAGVMSGAYAIAMAVGAPVIGRIVDYRGQRTALLATAVAGAAAFAALAYSTGRGTAAPLLFAVIAGVATPPLEPCLRALWPTLVRGGPPVDVAYALEAAVQELIFVLGPLLVVVITAVSGPRLAVLVGGAIALAGTLVFATTEESRDWRGEPREAHWAGPLRSAAMRTLLLEAAAIGMSVGVLAVGLPAYGETLDSTSVGGWLLALSAVGSLAGGLYYGARTWGGEAGVRLAALLGLMAMCTAPLIAVPPLALMVVLVTLSGVMIAPAISCEFVLVGLHAPDGTVTEAFSWLITSFLVGSSIGSVLAGAAVDRSGVGAAFALATAAAAAGSVTVLARRRTLA